MNARLLYVMDPLCSWCWGFLPVLQALAAQAAEQGVTTHVVVGGLRSESLPMTPAQRVRVLGHWQQVNASTGQLFDFNAGMPQGFVYDTTPACRALVAARRLDAGKVLALLERIQQAFYREGQDLSRGPLLGELAERAGYARRTFAKCFDSMETAEETRADFEWVQRLGIAGFPTLLADNGGQLALLTNGYQPHDQLAPLLTRWLERLHA